MSPQDIAYGEAIRGAVLAIKKALAIALTLDDPEHDAVSGERTGLYYMPTEVRRLGKAYAAIAGLE